MARGAEATPKSENRPAILGELRDSDSQLAARTAVSDANMAMEMIADAPLVVYTGRLHERKGLDDVVHAWEKIARRRPNARLWLIGEGPPEKKRAID